MFLARLFHNNLWIFIRSNYSLVCLSHVNDVNPLCTVIGIKCHLRVAYLVISRPLGILGFPDGSAGKESAGNAGNEGKRRFYPCIRKIPWRRTWQPSPVFLPGKSYGQRSLIVYSPWGCRVRQNRSFWAQHIWDIVSTGYPAQVLAYISPSVCGQFPMQRW